MAPATAFQRIIDDLVDIHGSQSAVASMAGLTASSFGRHIKAKDTLGIDSLLLLAKNAGIEPSGLLRAAHKSQTADLIDALYGEPREPLSDLDRQLIALSVEQKRSFVHLLNAHLVKNAPTRGKPPLERRSARGKRAS